MKLLAITVVTLAVLSAAQDTQAERKRKNKNRRNKNKNRDTGNGDALEESDISIEMMLATLDEALAAAAPQDEQLHWNTLLQLTYNERRDQISKPFSQWMVDFYNDRQGFRSTCDGGSLECGGLFDFSAIWGYGCWCWFGADAGKGRNQDVDGVDAMCKSLQQCYRCAVLDAKTDGDICEPWATTYNVQNSKVGQGIMAKCQESNPTDECAFHTCCCEMEFITGIFNSFFQGTASYNPANKHDSGTFDYEQRCPANPSGPVNRECCGTYPDRRIFNSDKNQCCTDGSIINSFQTCP